MSSGLRIPASAVAGVSFIGYPAHNVKNKK
jgi:hypothetical protein